VPTAKVTNPGGPIGGMHFSVTAPAGKLVDVVVEVDDDVEELLDELVELVESDGVVQARTPRVVSTRVGA